MRDLNKTERFTVTATKRQHERILRAVDQAEHERGVRVFRGELLFELAEDGVNALNERCDARTDDAAA